MRRRQQPCALEKVAVLDAAQRRPPPAITHRFRNPQQGVRHGRDPECYRLLHHIVGEGRRRRQRGRRRQKRRRRGNRGRKDNKERQGKAGHRRDVGHHRRQLQQRFGLPPGRRIQVATSHRIANLSSLGQACVRLFPSLDRHQPPHAAQAGPTRPHGYHGRLGRRGDQVTHRGSAPPRCRHSAQGGEVEQGMGPSPTDGPAHHPDGKRYQQNLRSDLAVSHNPSLPQREERNGPPNRLFPDLRRGKSLIIHLLLLGPPPRAHPGNPRPGLADGNIASPDPSIFRGTRERPAAGNEDQSPPVNGTRLLIKRRSGQATVTEGPRPRVHIRAATLNTEFLEVNGVQPGRGEPYLFVDGDMDGRG